MIVENFAAVLAAINDLKSEDVVADYAIGGAMALIFWSEPAATFDVDVFVLLPSEGTLVSLQPIYDWARGRGYPEKAEHIVIEGVPVQMIPAHNDLAEEAIAMAADLEYSGVPARVIRAEYLIAMALEPAARTRKRLERVGSLLDEVALDRRLLEDLLRRYNLKLPDHE